MKFYEMKRVLLTKQDTNVLKGSAAFMIMASHLSYVLITYGNPLWVFKLIQKTGGGIWSFAFFFVSGYGLAKSHYSKRTYWRARLKRVIVPSLCLLLLFSIIIQRQGERSIDVNFILYNMIESAWFIDVIVLEYLFYSVAHAATNEHLQLVFIILMNVILAFVFK